MKIIGTLSQALVMSCFFVLSSSQSRATQLPANDNTSTPYLGVDESDTTVPESDVYASWLNRTRILSEGTYSFGSGTTWSAITTNSSWFYKPASAWVQLGNNRNMVICVPMLPGPTTGQTVSLASGASGLYNNYFYTMGQNLVANHLQNSILRLGWEFDGSWYAWSVATDGDAKNFVTYWKHIVDTLRSVPGQNFKFCWSGAIVYVGANPAYPLADAYPSGNDTNGIPYVDMVGLDVYDVSSSSYPWPNGDTPQQILAVQESVWSSQLNTTSSHFFGIPAWQTIANNNSVPMSFPEWGLVNATDGGLDDTYFMQQMTNYIQNSANNVNFASYYDTGDSKLSPTDGFVTPFPNGTALYKSTFAIPLTATPTLSKASGTSFVVNFSVTPTSTTTGATIYYTTDGTIPTTSSSSVASGGSISITGNETLKIVAGATGYALSPVVSANYYVTGQLTGGDSNTLALKNDGTVWIWGSYGTSSPAQVSGLSSIVAVSSAHGNQFAVSSSGTLYAWGFNSYGQCGTGGTSSVSSPTAVAGVSNVIAVAAGEYFTVALESNGTVWAWGGGGNGNLGQGNTNNYYTPQEVLTAVSTPLTGIASIGAGSYAAYAVTTGNQLYAWGRDTDGELGDGGSTQQDYAKATVGSVSEIFGGTYQANYLKTDGTVWGMGANNNGQLGDGTVTSPRRTPVQAVGLSNITAIGTSPGGSHCVALKNDGSVWAMGTNTYGELGQGTTSSYSDTPVEVQASSGLNFAGGIAVAAGASHTIIAKAGSVWCTGDNGNGQLGNGTTTNSAYPVQSTTILLAPTVIIPELAGGDSNSVALKNDGTVWLWGSGGTSSPAQVSGLANVAAVSSAQGSQFAVKSDGTFWSWGSNTYGQLGDGTTTSETSPEQIVTLVDMVDVKAGEFFTLGLKEDGTVWAWGSNTYGELGNGGTTNSYTPVEVQASSGVNLTGVVAIGTGANTAYVIKSDGSVWSWGRNAEGEVGDGTTTQRDYPVSVFTGASQIVAGYYHATALRPDGTVWSWGQNSDGQVDDGTTTNRLSPVQSTNLFGIGSIGVAPGGYHGVALKKDGTVWTWGLNSSGQLGNGTTTQANSAVQVYLNSTAWTYFTTAQFIGGGGAHSLMAEAGGSTWASGLNSSGQLGNGTTTNSNYLVQSGSLLLTLLRDWYHGMSVDLKRLFADMHTSSTPLAKA